MTLLSMATGESSLYPIPPVNRSALSVDIQDAATLDEAEATIRVALAMQYALRMGAFSPRMIRVLRVNVLGLSQPQLALKLSYGQSALSQWELGKNDMPPDAYIALVDLVRERLATNAELIKQGHAVRQRLESVE